MSKHIKLKEIQTIVLLMGVISFSCVETFDFQSEIETYENALVIEATITNELKKQEILLSRTFRLEEGGPYPESGAIVKVVDGTNTEYVFRESDSAGIYVSTIAFTAKQNLDYTLQITTTNGKEYSSTAMQLTQKTKIDSLYAVRDFNEDGLEGISIYIDSYDPSGNSKYYRHEYEETYKIIAPFWVDKDLVVISPADYSAFGVLYGLAFVPRSLDEQICYNTVVSNTINLTSTVNLNEDRLDTYRIRFISRDNYITSHRYSILVRQYVQSRGIQVYYENLKLFSESESLLSEHQPGFFEGNVFSIEKTKDRVIGFFEVASVDSKRVYFKYEDFFPEEELPPYANGCLFDNPPLFTPLPSGPLFPLLAALEAGVFKYYDENIPQSEFEGPAIIVTRSCGDCTVLGQTEAPDFWIE